MASRTLGPGSLKIGPTGSPIEWAGNLTKTELTPTTNAEDDVPLLDGSNLSGEETTTWTLGGALQQDYEFDSLEKFCFDNAGKELPFAFTPSKTGSIDWSGIVKIRPVKIGGDVKKRNASDFEFPVIGRPTPGRIGQ